MRAALVKSDASGQVVIPGPVRALRWVSRTLAGFATFAAENQLGLSQVLADDGMVYPFRAEANIVVSGLPALEPFWYVVAADDNEARWLRPVASRLSQLGDSVLLTDANAVLTSDSGVTLVDDT